jgi:hypothetical protein
MGLPSRFLPAHGAHAIRQTEDALWPWPECPKIIILFRYGPHGAELPGARWPTPSTAVRLLAGRLASGKKRDAS